MNLASIFKNPFIIEIGEILLGNIVALVKSMVIPRIKRVAFEKMTEYMQIFGDFILEEKAKVEATETTVDDEAYALSKEAYKAFLDQANALYDKM